MPETTDLAGIRRLYDRVLSCSFVKPGGDLDRLLSALPALLAIAEYHAKAIDAMKQLLAEYGETVDALHAAEEERDRLRARVDALEAREKLVWFDVSSMGDGDLWVHVRGGLSINLSAQVGSDFQRENIEFVKRALLAEGGKEESRG